MKKKIFGFLAVALVSLLILASCGKKYTVDFFDDETVVATVEVAEGETVTLPADPTKEGLTFDGWYVDPNCITAFDETTPITEYTAIYAKWSVKLTFETNGGTAIEPMVKKGGSVYELPANPKKEGYAFVGWYTDPTFKTELPALVFPKTNTTAYAKWRAFDQTTKIAFNNFASNDESAFTVSGNKFTATETKGEWTMVQTKFDCNLAGYDTIVMTVVGTKDIDILLKFQDGGIEAAEERFTLTGSEQELIWTFPAETLANSGQGTGIFGWFLNPGVVGAGAEVEIKSCVLYRTMEDGSENTMSSIVFNSNKGSLVNPIFAKIGDAVTAPTEPTREGFIFGGWYTDAELTQAYEFTTMPEAPVTLYAKWDLAKYFSVNLLGDAYSELDPNTYTFNLTPNALLIQKIGTGEWQFAKGTMTGLDIVGTTTLVVKLKGVADQRITFKVNNQNGAAEKHITCDGTVQTFYFDITEFTINTNDPALTMFVNGGTAAASEVFEVYELKYTNQPAPVSLMDDTFAELDPNTYTFTKENGVLKVQKTGTGEWQFAIGSSTSAAIVGMKYLNVTIKGVAGQRITFKVNDQNGAAEKHITCDGTVQVISIDITDVTIDANKLAVSLFINGGTAAASEVFEIYQLEYSAVANPVSLMDDTFAELDPNTYTFTKEDGVLKIQKTGTGEWQFAIGSTKGEAIVGCTNLTVVIKGAAGERITFKVNDQNGAAEKHITCDGTVQVISIDITDVTIDANRLAVSLFINGGTAAASSVFEVYQLYYSN